MRRAFLAGVLLAVATPAWAAPVPPTPSPDAAALAGRIDRMLESAWAEQGIKPAPAASDAEFLRRAYLDLAGRIPSVAEARKFLADGRPDKRNRLVAELLARPTYVRHFTAVWRALLVPEANTGIQARAMMPTFDAWLRRQFDKNVPYDQLVRELLTTPVGPEAMNNVYGRGTGEPTPTAYYMAKELKPENLAAAAARQFLGVRLECAQCHDHPFAEWKRDQFWGLAAFFAGLTRQGRGEFPVPGTEIADRREITVPNTSRVIQAAFPDGTEPEWKPKVSARQTLAAWITAPDNPYFARTAVNRVWAHLFGVGLVEPVDEMIGGQDTVAHHQELLDELARAFAGKKFDVKFLVEAITATRAYQLTSGGGAAAGDGKLFSRHPLRGLTGEQLFDSVAVATSNPDAGMVDDVFVINPRSPRAEFVTKFGQQTGKPTEYETSILHALTLMNGRVIGDATAPDRSELLAAVLEAPFLDTRGRVEALYLATLSRPPTEKELTRALAFIDRAGGTADKGSDSERARWRKEATADVFWALLNSGEFMLNH